MDGRTDERTENIPILLDFALYRGSCPASSIKTKEKVEQSKGTADHMMPLGYLFFLKIFSPRPDQQTFFQFFLSPQPDKIYFFHE